MNSFMHPELLFYYYIFGFKGTKMLFLEQTNKLKLLVNL